MSVRNYQDLLVWQRAMDVVEIVYRATQQWPKEELYALTNQTRRAAVSVRANIAEGQGRTGAKEFAHHLSIANGSLYEMQTHMLIAQRLRFGRAEDYPELLAQTADVARLLRGLIKSLQ